MLKSTLASTLLPTKHLLKQREAQRKQATSSLSQKPKLHLLSELEVLTSFPQNKRRFCSFLDCVNFTMVSL